MKEQTIILHPRALFAFDKWDRHVYSYLNGVIKEVTLFSCRCLDQGFRGWVPFMGSEWQVIDLVGGKSDACVRYRRQPSEFDLGERCDFIRNRFSYLAAPL
ncbi:hypothetical protein CDAR_67251 [Caerostris darwini]|uniref:Uncharacterized protein n=1 Tax=Caerostris darwini TaxID=1538125 RepID=A0AAV4VQE5_9ARAC|nr:hypothetical protein CDAR_67251 [Caerostris darwini]